MIATVALMAALACPPSGANWSSTAQFGNTSWQIGYRVNNDEWGAGYGSQTIWTSPTEFGACDIRQPVTSPVNNVKSYPSAGLNLPGYPVSSYKAISSSYNFTPSTTSNGVQFQMLYDMWLNALPGGSDPIEVGVVPFRNLAGQPHGTVLGHAWISGVRYTVRNGTGPGGHLYYTFTPGPYATSGTINLRRPLRWLWRHNYIKTTDKLMNISGGWEIWNSPSTGPFSLRMNSYNVNLVR
jgi:hypothetical protein